MSGFAERWGPPDTVPRVQMPCQRPRTFAAADVGRLDVGQTFGWKLDFRL